MSGFSDYEKYRYYKSKYLKAEAEKAELLQKVYRVFVNMYEQPSGPVSKQMQDCFTPISSNPTKQKKIEEKEKKEKVNRKHDEEDDLVRELEEHWQECLKKLRRKRKPVMQKEPELQPRGPTPPGFWNPLVESESKQSDNDTPEAV